MLVYLPDPVSGFYRATRFDWAGVIGSLKWKGHEFFGEWCERDPEGFESIIGPVDEYFTAEDIFENGPDYEEAGVGGVWPKIGVGLLRRDSDEPFVFWRTYPIANAGTRRWDSDGRSLSMVHVVDDPVSGWGYAYTKSIELTDEPGFVLRYKLENTGRKTYDLTVYNHHFLQMGGPTVGIDYRARFPREIQTDIAPEGGLEVAGKELLVRGPLGGGSFAPITKSGAEGWPHAFEAETAKVGIRCRGTLPLSQINLWACHRAFCPEPFSPLVIAPGETERWTRTYELYEPTAPGR